MSLVLRPPVAWSLILRTGELTKVEDMIDSDKCQLLSNSKNSGLEKKMEMVTLVAKKRGLLKGKKLGSAMSVTVSNR